MQVGIGSGQTELVAAPVCGGGIASLRWQGMDMLRPASPEALAAGDPTGLAEFPLAPFVNRIAHGRFSWQGKSVTLARPPQGGAHALHGHAWLRPWLVKNHSATNLTLALEAPASPAWPWDVRLERTFAVADARVDIALVMAASGPGPMPASLGFHPYFPSAEAVLRVQTARQILSSGDLLPQGFAPTPACSALAQGAAVEALSLDHAFSGWDGAASIHWPNRTLTISAEANLPFVHIYAPKDAGFFCVEPVSAMPDAVNWQGPEPSGLQTLAPGQTLCVRMRMAFAPA